MRDGTRLIFWLDLAILLVVSMLALAGQWDYVIAIVIAMLVLNLFDFWQGRRTPPAR